jgi:hypothetical protein
MRELATATGPQKYPPLSGNLPAGSVWQKSGVLFARSTAVGGDSAATLAAVATRATSSSAQAMVLGDLIPLQDTARLPECFTNRPFGN